MRGADSALVRRALATDEPLPGTGGFAGELDGRLVRDVLGRELVYSESDDPTTWSHNPEALAAPSLVPAGHIRDDSGDTRVWELPKRSPIEDADRAVARVHDRVVESVDEVATDGLAIAFSGGLDSSILAARLDAPLYVAGFEGCHDIDAARDSAAALSRDLRTVVITHEDLRRTVPGVVRSIGRTNVMDLSIALPLFIVAERAAEDGFDRLALGQGADELFGGYAKVARAPEDPRVEANTVRAARREMVLSLPAQVERDLRALRAAGVEPVAPLLHDRVVVAALELPGTLLVAGEERKVALRRAADFLPQEVREREKKAVQYGTYVSRELDRLARQAGFKRRMDDHVTNYIESLIE